MDFLIDRLYRGFRFLLDYVIGYGAMLAMVLATWLAIAEVARRYVFGVVFDWGQDAVTRLDGGVHVAGQRLRGRDASVLCEG